MNEEAVPSGSGDPLGGETSPVESGQYLTVAVGGETYGINIMNVREIIKYGDLTRVPMMPDFIEGVINLRGSVVPIINLGVRLTNQAPEVTKRTSFVIVEINDGESRSDIGIVVEMVNEVLDIPGTEVEPPPTFGTKIRTDFIAGMGKVDGKFLVLLNVDRVLSIDELSQIRAARNEMQGQDRPPPVDSDSTSSVADGVAQA